MAPIDEDEYSSEGEGEDVETTVLLGVPDVPITNEKDLVDAAVSRIGGHPAFVSTDPPFSSSQCKICSRPMELLVQMWCPFEDSPMDRALYVWGCAIPECQSKSGSVRAWRGLRRNDEYAAKLEKKAAKFKPKAASSIPSLNPFSATSGGSFSPNAFGLGTQIFGDSTPTASEKAEEGSDSDEEASDEEMITALAATTLEDSPWKAAPSYPPLYLNTESEYIPAAQKLKLPPGVQVVDNLDDDPKGNKDVSWIAEAYENSLDVDVVFERFSKRVGYDGDQCVRYELDGQPLPYASDDVFEHLFPKPPSAPLPVTKAAFTVVPPLKRVYNPSCVPLCPFCKAKRVFECQLMPNLINVVREAKVENQRLTDEERRKVVEQELKKGGSGRGMEWGTCLVFSCSRDCSLDDHGQDTREVWREEVVMIQWEA